MFDERLAKAQKENIFLRNEIARLKEFLSLRQMQKETINRIQEEYNRAA